MCVRVLAGERYNNEMWAEKIKMNVNQVHLALKKVVTFGALLCPDAVGQKIFLPPGKRDYLGGNN